MSEPEIRTEIVAACKKLEADGLNRGASGNISVRLGDSMLITPTAVADTVIAPRMISRMALDTEECEWDGSHAPSTEWRFHRDILRARPEMNAVVHTHAPWSTVLSVAQKPIPAIHYMIAAFGGPDIRVAEYARYGTANLSTHIVAAMADRNGCLMANHGMVVAGSDLTHAVWLAEELEALAHQHYHAQAIGGGHVLSSAQIEETARGFENYGVRTKEAP